MENKIFNEYGRLAKMIAQLEDEKEALREKIFGELKTLDEPKFRNDFGTFTVYPTKTWKYTPAVDKEKKKLDELKKKEEETGKAKATVVERLKFTPLKEGQSDEE